MDKLKRLKLIEKISDDVYNGMDHKSLYSYVIEQLISYYDNLDDIELTEEVEEYYDCKLNEVV